MWGDGADAGATRRAFVLKCLGCCAGALGMTASSPVARALAAAPFGAADLQAALIAKITSFVDWPASAGLVSGSSPFLVAVLGTSDVTARLHDLFERQPPQGHPARVRALSAPSRTESAHVLFVAPSFRGDIAEVAQIYERSATLTIGQGKQLCTLGLAVNLVELDARMSFEINRQALKRAGLRASYHLLARAHLVDGP
jgi:hypothetical protein